MALLCYACGKISLANACSKCGSTRLVQAREALGLRDVPPVGRLPGDPELLGVWRGFAALTNTSLRSLLRIYQLPSSGNSLALLQRTYKHGLTANILADALEDPLRLQSSDAGSIASRTANAESVEVGGRRFVKADSPEIEGSGCAEPKRMRIA